MAPPVEIRELYKHEAEKLPLSQRMWKGFMSNPAAFIGGGGFVGMVSYAAYNFKNRKASASMYVMHYRVVAQFMFIGAMLGGVAASVAYGTYQLKNERKAQELERKAQENDTKR